MALISVIVPVYNSEKFIERALYSIVNQTYKNIEIIVINDGSTDNSMNIIQKIQEKDKRIKLFSKKNGGLSSARNEGLTHASGKYCMFIDSDDYVDPEMIEIMLGELELTNADLVVCGLSIDYENNNFEIERSRKTIIDQKMILNDKSKIVDTSCLLKKDGIIDSCCNKLYRRSLIEEYNIAMPYGELFEDTEFNFLYLKYVKVLVVIPNCFYHYMQRNANRITNTYNVNKFKYLRKRVLTMKAFITTCDNNHSMDLIYYWYTRYVYSTLMDMYGKKISTKSFLKELRKDPIYIELKQMTFLNINFLKKLYIFSLKSENYFFISIITKLGYLLKTKRNDIHN